MGASPSGEYDILDYRMHHGTLPLGWLSVVIQQCWPLFLAFVAILLRDDLLGVVHEAFQPTQVSMWLDEAGSGHDMGAVPR